MGLFAWNKTVGKYLDCRGISGPGAIDAYFQVLRGIGIPVQPLDRSAVPDPLPDQRGGLVGAKCRHQRLCSSDRSRDCTFIHGSKRLLLWLLAPRCGCHPGFLVRGYNPYECYSRRIDPGNDDPRDETIPPGGERRDFIWRLGRIRSCFYTRTVRREVPVERGTSGVGLSSKGMLLFR